MVLGSLDRNGWTLTQLETDFPLVPWSRKARSVLAWSTGPLLTLCIRLP